MGREDVSGERGGSSSIVLLACFLQLEEMCHTQGAPLPFPLKQEKLPFKQKRKQPGILEQVLFVLQTLCSVAALEGS